jgi:hypothetical protein
MRLLGRPDLSGLRPGHRTAGATIAASTVNGGVSCDFPIQIKSSGRNSLRGTIADGGTTIKATSVNGAIHLGSL